MIHFETALPVRRAGCRQQFHQPCSSPLNTQSHWALPADSFVRSLSRLEAGWICAGAEFE